MSAISPPLVFRNLSWDFGLRIQSDVHAIREDELSNVNVFIHLFHRTFDAVEFFVGSLILYTNKGCLRMSFPAEKYSKRHNKKNG